VLESSSLFEDVESCFVDEVGVLVGGGVLLVGGGVEDGVEEGGVVDPGVLEGVEEGVDCVDDPDAVLLPPDPKERLNPAVTPDTIPPSNPPSLLVS